MQLSWGTPSKMARRAVIYARYSTDRQDERSIDDQIALCRAAAARERLSVVATYHDSAASGASIHGRAGLAALMAAARENRFEAVVVEELERLSRDLEELPGIFKRLSFLGIDVIAAHEGKADQLRVGLRLAPEPGRGTSTHVGTTAAHRRRGDLDRGAAPQGCSRAHHAPRAKAFVNC